MSNVIKSAKLDFSLLKPYLKTMCFVMLFPTFFAAINRSLMVGVSFAMYFIAMMTGYSFTISEKNSMERLYGILPVRKSEIVIGRYIYIIIMGLIALIVSLIFQPAVLIALGERLTASDLISAAAMGILLFGIYTADSAARILQIRFYQGKGVLYNPCGRLFSDFASYHKVTDRKQCTYHKRFRISRFADIISDNHSDSYVCNINNDIR